MKIDPNLIEETEEERQLRHHRRRQVRASLNFDETDLTRLGVGDPLLVARVVIWSSQSENLSAIIRGAQKLLDTHVVAAHCDPEDLVTWRRKKREAQAAKKIAGEELERVREEIRSLQVRLIEEKEHD